MKRYEKYKESGIEWIGEIPSHWEMKRIRHVANIFGRIGYRGYTVSDLVHDGNGAITISPSNMKDSGMDFSECTYLSWEKYEESPEIKIFEGDILFVKTGSTYGKSAIVRQLPKEATVNPQIVVLKDINCNNIFLWYSIKSPFIQLQVEETVVGGTIPTISQSKINNYTFPAPPPKEQTAIASYLDRKTAEIDELIADKKRLLELYEEEKTAIINQAVTKGINPDAPMKDSGIEWLGAIPEHWQVKRLRHVAQIFGRIGYRGYKTTDLVSKGEGAITISPSNMKGYYMDFSDCSYLSWEKYEESPEIMIFNGDILFVKTGSTYGKSSLVENLPERATINPQIIVLKEIQCNNKLLWYIIKSEYTQFQVEGTVVGGTNPTISQAKINNYEFAITPDSKEQQEIVDFIDNECARIDTQVERTKKLIDLLKEYREALISEVVTGQIKVID